MSGDPFAVATVALAVIFRSRLNFTDVSRKLGELVQIDGSLTCTESDARGRGDLRLAATIQIATNRALREPAVADRFRDEPDFAQMAVDALYYIARRWSEEPRGTIDLSRERLRQELESRMSLRASPAVSATASGPVDSTNGGTPATARATPADGDPRGVDVPPAVPPPSQGAAAPQAAPRPDAVQVIGETDLNTLHNLVLMLVEYLVNFSGLVAQLRAEPPGDWPLADIVLPGVPGLLKSDEGGQFCYRFILDEFGRPSAEEPPQLWTDNKLALEVAKVREGLQGVEELIRATGLTIGDFRAAQVLPASISDGQLVELLPQLRAVELARIMTSGRAAAIDAARSFMHGILEFRGPLAEAVVLVRNLVRDADCDAPRALQAAARHFDPSRTIIMPPDRPDLAGMVGINTSFEVLASRYAGDALLAQPPRAADEIMLERRWAAWRDRLVDFSSLKVAPVPPSYDDMLLAVLERPPGSLFRTMLSQMTVVEWSRVVLAGLPKGDEASVAPIWALVAGLRALGFDARLLSFIADQKDLAETPADAAAAARIATAAPTRPRGVIHLHAQGQAEPAVPPDPAAKQPLLAIGPEDADAYKEGLGWLQDLGAFEGRTYETTAGEEELREPAGEVADGGGESA